MIPFSLRVAQCIYILLYKVHQHIRMGSPPI